MAMRYNQESSRILENADQFLFLYLGTASYALLYPLDTIRTRLQVQVHKIADNHGAVPEEYTSGLDCALKMIKSEGWMSLYKGLTAGIVGVGVSNAVYFWWYSLLKSLTQRFLKKKVLTPGVNMIVATLAGVINIIFTSPIWVVNTRMMLQKKRPTHKTHSAPAAPATPQSADTSVASQPSASAAPASAAPASSPLAVLNATPGATLAATAVAQLNTAVGNTPPATASAAAAVEEESEEEDEDYYTGVIDAFVKIAKKEGLAGLYRGFLPSLILTSNPAIQLTAYDQLAAFMVRRRARSLQRDVARTKLTSIEYFLLGALAKAISTVITYPYQVVKSRQQADFTKTEEALSMMDVMCTMLRKEGAASFTQGMGAKLVQTCLTAAVTFATYEKILTMVKRIAVKYKFINP